MKRYGQQGFTLVELLVTVAIVMLLATYAAPKLMTAINQSKQVRVDKDLRTIVDALERYHVDRGHYPRRLRYLVRDGYLRDNFSFKSPTTGHYYFYAVDDNRSDTSPKAFAIGNPGKVAASFWFLYVDGPLPRGKDPDFTAWAWVVGSETTFIPTYTDNRSDDLEPPPASLSAYRLSCRPGTTMPCDLYTN